MDGSHSTVLATNASSQPANAWVIDIQRHGRGQETKKAKKTYEVMFANATWRQSKALGKGPRFVVRKPIFDQLKPLFRKCLETKVGPVIEAGTLGADIPFPRFLNYMATLPHKPGKNYRKNSQDVVPFKFPDKLLLAQKGDNDKVRRVSGAFLATYMTLFKTIDDLMKQPVPSVGSSKDTMIQARKTMLLGLENLVASVTRAIEEHGKKKQKGEENNLSLQSGDGAQLIGYSSSFRDKIRQFSLDLASEEKELASNSAKADAQVKAGLGVVDTLVPETTNDSVKDNAHPKGSSSNATNCAPPVPRRLTSKAQQRLKQQQRLAQQSQNGPGPDKSLQPHTPTHARLLETRHGTTEPNESHASSGHNTPHATTSSGPTPQLIDSPQDTPPPPVPRRAFELTPDFPGTPALPPSGLSTGTTGTTVKKSTSNTGAGDTNDVDDVVRHLDLTPQPNGTVVEESDDSGSNANYSDSDDRHSASAHSEPDANSVTKDGSDTEDTTSADSDSGSDMEADLIEHEDAKRALIQRQRERELRRQQKREEANSSNGPAPQTSWERQRSKSIHQAVSIAAELQQRFGNRT